jgi:putative hydrolase of HD superfamily
MEKLLGELGHLATLPRADFHKAGVEHPVTVGTLSALAAQLAFVIAAAEGGDPQRSAVMALFASLPNARTVVLEYLAGPALDRQAVRRKVIEQQLADLPSGPIAKRLQEIVNAFENRQDQPDREAEFAFEGYRLASAYFDAIYTRRGYATSSAWIHDAEGRVKSATGTAILAGIRQNAFYGWWNDLLPKELRIVK